MISSPAGGPLRVAYSGGVQNAQLINQSGEEDWRREREREAERRRCKGRREKEEGETRGHGLRRGSLLSLRSLSDPSSNTRVQYQSHSMIGVGWCWIG